MKRILILLISSLTLINCSENVSDTQPNATEVFWSLTNTKGGVADINDNFEIGKIKWVFNEFSETLIVNNENTDNSKQDGFDTGEYSFSVSAINNELFLFIDSIEFGTFSASDTRLVINENIKTTGTSNDGFIYTFTKTIINK